MNRKEILSFVLISIVFGLMVGIGIGLYIKPKPPEPNYARYVIEGRECIIVVKEHTVRVECNI